MKTLLANPEYSLYIVGGNDYNPRWKNSIVDLLTALIADVYQPAEERDRAARVLKFYAAVEQQPLTNGETNPVVSGMHARGGARALWEWPDSFAIETVTGQAVAAGSMKSALRSPHHCQFREQLRDADGEELTARLHPCPVLLASIAPPCSPWAQPARCTVGAGQTF